MRAAFCLTKIFLLSHALAVFGAQPVADADRWLTNAAVFPEKFAKLLVSTNNFVALHAELVADQLQVTCPADKTISELRIVSSADAPGRWFARDWRSRPMNLRGANWVAELPVDGLDIPIIYFVRANTTNGSVVSPMRITGPRALGLEHPTHLFWAFLEGFEQDLDSWRVIDSTEMHTDATAKNGRAALVVRVPAGRRSVTAQTTRLRGWFLQEHGATGVGLWLRVKKGTGTATFELIANALSTNQVVSRRVDPVKVSTNWTKAALFFESFPKLPLGDVDLFSIELSGEPGTEFLIDNVYLMGRWRDDF